MAHWTLALGGSDHDASAALINDGDIRVMIEQERLSRRKHGASFWYESPVQSAIDYCLSAERISLEDIEAIVASDTLPARVKHDFRRQTMREYGHHLCHAASAYMMLPYGTRAGVIVYDGFGSAQDNIPSDRFRRRRETFSFFVFGPDGYDCIGATHGMGFFETEEFPIGVTDSIGMLYEIVTALLGYDLMDSGKTMGLSSYGRPRFLGVLERFATLNEDISRCFRCATDDLKLHDAIAAILLEGRGGFAVRADLAASLQALMNQTLLHCERFFRNRKIDALCISGGCALNTVANSFLVDHSTLGIPIVVPPHCGDAGLGLGALWLDEFHKCEKARELTFRGKALSPAVSRPGRIYTVDERRAAVQAFYPRLVLDASVDCARALARLIANGAIVAALNCASEIGPRALGGRSLFADPRSTLTRERINRRVKGREPYRPLGPVVLQSRYNEYFDDPRCADPFMLKVARVRDRCRRDAPAVVHIDGTARVQVVGGDGDPFLIELLQSFEQETGVGVLINTSFNRRGEPIVETPLDAIDAFLGMGIEGLYLDGEFYRPVGEDTPMA